MKKIVFSKLNQISETLPSIWEGKFDDESFCYIVYDNDELDIYSSVEKIDLNTCNLKQYLVLSIEDILHKPECSHISTDVLYEILDNYDLLEKK
jgi:hypothetical protein